MSKYKMLALIPVGIVVLVVWGVNWSLTNNATTGKSLVTPTPTLLPAATAISTWVECGWAQTYTDFWTVDVSIQCSGKGLLKSRIIATTVDKEDPAIVWESLGDIPYDLEIRGDVIYFSLNSTDNRMGIDMWTLDSVNPQDAPIATFTPVSHGG